MNTDDRKQQCTCRQEIVWTSTVSRGLRLITHTTNTLSGSCPRFSSAPSFHAVRHSSKVCPAISKGRRAISPGEPPPPNIRCWSANGVSIGPPWGKGAWAGVPASCRTRHTIITITFYSSQRSSPKGLAWGGGGLRTCVQENVAS